MNSALRIQLASASDDKNSATQFWVRPAVTGSKSESTLDNPAFLCHLVPNVRRRWFVMRRSRIIKEDDDAVYHCIGRIVGGEFLLGDSEKETLRIMLHQNAAFAGVEIITHCVMSNHFHLLVRVPVDRTVPDAEILRRVQGYYSKKNPVRVAIETAMENGGLCVSVRERMLARMGDLSVFMKELKQRYSRWHNRQYNRFGTLWAERFKSVLVQNSPSAMATVAAYIDLNPIRAGLVSDPKDYRWCGYAEAVAGVEEVRRGIMTFLEPNDWTKAGPEYRQRLFVESGVAGHSDKQSLDRDAIKKVIDAGGELTLPEVLRVRVRYFSDGVALGSKDFVDSVRAEFREHFGTKRKTGARTIGKGNAIPGLFAIRDLRGDRFT